MARRRSFTRPAPRTKMWIGSGVGDTTVAAGATVLVSTFSAGALALRPFTILRTHMLLTIRSDQTGADETLIGSYGELVVTEVAAAVGVTAVPDPSGISGDPEAAWYVWQALATRFLFVSGVGV